jgi:hypothetical protein
LPQWNAAMRSIFFVLLATDRIVKVIEVSGVQVIAKNAGILLTAYFDFL